ncbi:helix-turn-helix transcriptional regulator [Nonomuraea africana]|uniref:helix-turn-helix transcriptional regulator n=1 Tax=Nonomuraea africana TaxID=46171 RepID=UPI003411B3A8
MNLAGLGLTAEQERVYRYFLRSPHADLDAAAAHLGIPHLPAVLDRLRTLGVIDDSLAALSPAVAVAQLIRRRMEQTSRELHQLSAAWDIVRDLAEEQRSGRPVELVERIEGVENVNRRIREFSSAKEVMNIKNVVSTLRRDDEKVVRFRKRLSAGLVSRSLVPEATLADPEQLALAREGHALGDLCRVSAECARQVLIISRSVAFVQIDPADRTAGALLIRQPGAVAVLVDMFEGVWARARDLNEPQLAPIERQVLQALALHDKDETAARALNISVRKFRTHVAELMDRLGAGNRFQAALLAKERGWL